MRFYFEITAGLLKRSSIKTQLNNSKAKLEHWYPGCRVLLTENKNWFESKFYFEANDLPDSAEHQVRNWVNRLKKLSNSEI